jgi:pentatricopeptide repeat protein
MRCGAPARMPPGRRGGGGACTRGKARRSGQRGRRGRGGRRSPPRKGRQAGRRRGGPGRSGGNAGEERKSALPATASVQSERSDAQFLKALDNLRRHRRNITPRQMIHLVKRALARKPDQVLLDHVLALLPQLRLEDAKQKEGLAVLQAATPPLGKSQQTEAEVEGTPSPGKDSEMKRMTALMSMFARENKIEAAAHLLNMLKRREKAEKMRLERRSAREKERDIQESANRRDRIHFDKAAEERRLRERARRREQRDTVELEKWHVDTLVYNIMVNACAKVGRLDQAFDYFHEMRDRVISPDNVTFTTLFNACLKRGQSSRAEAVAQRMREEGLSLDLSSYNCLMHGALRASVPDIPRAFKLFQEMRNAGIKPDEISISCLLDGCAREAELFRRTQKRLALQNNEAGEHAETDAPGGDIVFIRDRQLALGLQARRSQMERIIQEVVPTDPNMADQIRLSNRLLASIVRCYGATGDLRTMFTQVDRAQTGGLAIREEVYCMLIRACGLEGDLEAAAGVLERIRHKGGKPTHAVFHAYLQACVSAEQPQLALNIVEMLLRSNVQGTEPLYLRILRIACLDCSDGTVCEDEDPGDKHIAGQDTEAEQNSDAEDARQSAELADDEVDDSGQITSSLDSCRPHKRLLRHDAVARVTAGVRAAGHEATLAWNNALVRFYGENGHYLLMWRAYETLRTRQLQPNLATFRHILAATLALERAAIILSPDDTLRAERARILRPRGQGKGAERERELSTLILSELRRVGVRPDLKFFNSIIRLLGYEDLRRLRDKPSKEATPEAAADVKAAQRPTRLPARIRAVLEEMRKEGLRPGVSTLQAISSACDRSGVPADAKKKILYQVPLIFGSHKKADSALDQQDEQT